MTRRSIAFEWYRWRHRRAAWAMAAFIVLAVIPYALVIRTLAESGLAGAGMAARDGGSPGFQLAFRTAGAMFRLLAVFALAWGAFAIAPELDAGTHRAPLLRVSRTSFVIGKCAFFGALAGGLSVFVMLISLAAGAFTYRLSDVAIGEVIVHSRGALLGSGLVAAALGTLSLLSLIALGMAVSASARSGEMALILSLMIVAVLWGLALLPGAAPWVFVGKVAWPFAVASSRSEGLKTASFAHGWPSFVFVNLAWTAGLLGLGTSIFRRRDLP